MKFTIADAATKSARVYQDKVNWTASNGQAVFDTKSKYLLLYNWLWITDDQIYIAWLPTRQKKVIRKFFLFSNLVVTS